MELEIKEEGGFKYASYGSGEPLVLLHGLFGALSNFGTLFEYFGKTYEVVIPLLPLYELPANETTVSSLADYVLRFIDFRVNLRFIC